MRVLVIGATGKTGRKLLQLLMKTNHRVTGVIRESKQAPLIEQYKATPLISDLTHDIRDIAKDQQAIIFVAGSRGKDVEGVDYKGLVKTVHSCIQHKIERFLYISSLNIDKNKEQCLSELEFFYSKRTDKENQEMFERLKLTEANDNYYNYLQSKKRAEEVIRQSGLNYTILRAGMLTEDAPTGKIEIAEGSLPKFGIVSRFNIAQVFITALQFKNTQNKTYTILDGEVAIENVFE